MPVFKSTYNILKTPWENEVFNPNWMDSDKLVLPTKKDWDYKRVLQIEDVNVWEVIFESGGGWGLYASWDPYAEFYLLMTGSKGIETFYGAGVQKHLKSRLKELNLSVPENKVWVDPDEMWIYQEAETKSNTLILP
jgi:hypothetical protein